jgi:predicted Zn-dependent peptidase
MKPAVAAAALLIAGALPAAGASDRYPAASASAVAAHVIAEPDDGAGLTGVQIFLPAGLERQTTANAGIASLVAECVLQTPVKVQGATLTLEAAEMLVPASVTYALDATSVHFYVESRPDRSEAAIALLHDALARPDFSQPAIAAARKSLENRSSDSEGNPFYVGAQMARRAYYLAGAGTSAYGSPASLDGLGPGDLQTFFTQNYRRGGLSAAIAGEPSEGAARAVAALGTALPDGSAVAPDRRVAAISSNSLKRIVARRDIGAPLTVLGFAAPSPSSPQFGSMLVTQALISSIFDQTDGTSPSAYQRTVQSFYEYEAMPSSFVVIINGARVDRTVGISEVLVLTKSLSKSKLEGANLDRAKAQARAWVLNSTLNLNDRSYMLGALAGQGVGADALNAVLDDIDRVTAAGVQKTANDYLQKFIVAEVLPRGDRSGGG